MSKYSHDHDVPFEAFITNHGYICERDSIVEAYQGLDDIPDEYKVMNIQKATKENQTIDNPNTKPRYGNVYGYIYDENGMHGARNEFEGSPENMANFIMFNKDHTVVMTDDIDQFVVSSTHGGFLDRVAYPALREEIIKEILPLQMGDKEPIDVAMQNGERNPIEQLAKDLDEFMFDYDFYGYQDSIDDRTEHVNQLYNDMVMGNYQPIVDYLKEAVEEGDYMVAEATSLLNRMNEMFDIEIGRAHV